MQGAPAEGARVIVSLTTLPDRIRQLGPTLRSLLRQTRPADEIVLAVPEFSRRQNRAYTVPHALTRRGGVTILRTPVDYGPATKFIPVIQRELGAGATDTRIIVVDDDRAYPRDMIATYLRASSELPDAALCFRGADVPPSGDWRDAKMIFGTRIAQPRAVDVITGCGSYLLQPRFVDERLWDFSDAPAAAFYMDDIWLSGQLSRRRVARYVVPCRRMMRTVLRQRFTMSLHDVPGGRQENNNALIAYFVANWRVPETTLAPDRAA